MKTPIFLLDTFTPEPFKGNPTAVCLIAHGTSGQRMHDIAKELSLPVTAFVETPDYAGHHRIHYYTVTGEIPACGHATLAAASVSMKRAMSDCATFVTSHNIVIETKQVNGIIWMDYPRYEPLPFQVRGDVLRALRLERYTAAFHSHELETLFIELDDAHILRSLKPDFRALLASGDVVKEIVLTSRSDRSDFDFLLRSFCPWIGIDEDPVTGSVHSVLAGHWAMRLQKKQLKAYQASSRGGVVYVNSLSHRVQIGGTVVSLLKGELWV